jgi:hypothetical protein
MAKEGEGESAILVELPEYNQMLDTIRNQGERLRELSRENQRLRRQLGLGQLIAQELCDLCSHAAE